MLVQKYFNVDYKNIIIQDIKIIWNIKSCVVSEDFLEKKGDSSKTKK